MKPGGFSDVSRPRYQDSRLLPAGSLQGREKRKRYPDMTISWMDWLLEKGEPDSNWYDFAEERPVWTKWWFRTGSTVLCIGCLVWFFRPFS
jgi:hypothetical protein